MNKKMLFSWVMGLFLSVVLIACGSGSDTTSSKSTTASSGSDTADSGSDETDTSEEANNENYEDHEASDDYDLNNSETISILLNTDSITADGTGLTIDGSKITITSAGIYSLSGVLADGQVIVDTEDEETVKLILNEVDITSLSSAPINIINSPKTVIILADNTENDITDGGTYIFEDQEDDEPNAAVFSKDDLTIYGNGSLNVRGNYNDGIASKDGLIIASGTISVNAVDDGIRGKDYLVIKDGDITVDVGGDGLKSDNDEDTSTGYISIEEGVIDIISGGDAIQAENDVVITGGEFTISSGGGSHTTIDEDLSAKGVKAGMNVIIDSGTFSIDSADDAIHSNSNLTINGGIYDISSGDDAVHGDSILKINDGDIWITTCFEGIESENITINGGEIYIRSNDDGLNGAGGRDESGIDPGRQAPSSGNYYLYINGGRIAVYATGDGIDVNGSIEMTDGVVIIHGPTSSANSALDYETTFNMNGGFLVAAGSAGMAQAPSRSSTQYSVMLTLSSAFPAKTLIHIQTQNGDGILTFSPEKRYQSIVFSSGDLKNSTAYSIYYGGSATGTVYEGLYQNGAYVPGTPYADFTVSDIVTSVR